MVLKVGADPELFIKDRSGILVSGFSMIRGTKVHPFPVNKGAVQVDGIALEYNIDPATTVEDFVNNNCTVMRSLIKMIPPNLEFNIIPCVDITPDFYKSQPDEAMMLGCEPSYNAYSEDVEKVSPLSHIRTAAGHLHLGWTDDTEANNAQHFFDCCALVKELDVFYNVLTLHYSDIELEMKRKMLYGAAGSFRPKSYGVEYRALSNFWIKDEELMKKVFEIAQTVFNRMLTGEKLLSDIYTGRELDRVTKEQIEEVSSLVSI